MMDFYLDAFRKYGTFSGRASRKQYWMFVLWNLIFYVVLFVLVAAMRNVVTLSLYYGYALVLLIPSLAILARRLHDTGRTAWWILICLVPFIGAVVLLVFSLLSGPPGDNKYGPNPQGAAQ